MKNLVKYIFEHLILEYLRSININKDFCIEIGNHADNRKLRGMKDNFKINLINITDKKIIEIINKFSNKILDKISNNTLICGNENKSIELIDYNITICIFLKDINDDKYILGVKSLWTTDDDYVNYSLKYKESKKRRDNTKIFISDIK